ncbi:MAG: prepilin-type N-terminal cleavage/methylation domain-containing protein, partial [Pseudomonadota bacterium]
MSRRRKIGSDLASGFARSQRGLSLVEMLVALAITAIVMTVFIQSLSQQARLNDRIRTVAAETLADNVAEGQFHAVVSGLTPVWREDDAGRFVGDREQFEGLTRTP